MSNNNPSSPLTRLVQQRKPTIEDAEKAILGADTPTAPTATEQPAPAPAQLPAAMETSAPVQKTADLATSVPAQAVAALEAQQATQPTSIQIVPKDEAVKVAGVVLNPELAAHLQNAKKPKKRTRVFYTKLPDDLFEAVEHLKDEGLDKTVVIELALRQYLGIPDPYSD